MNRRDRLGLLRDVEPLSGQSDAELRALLSYLDEVCVPAGVLVAQAGRLCHEFFVVASGRLEKCEHDVTSNLGPGDAFGWAAMRERGRHEATVRTVSSARLLVMSHEQFRAAEALSPQRASASFRRRPRAFVAG